MDVKHLFAVCISPTAETAEHDWKREIYDNINGATRALASCFLTSLLASPLRHRRGSKAAKPNFNAPENACNSPLCLTPFDFRYRGNIRLLISLMLVGNSSHNK